ncbi:GEVED domain-containing protein [Marilutibacter maris]|nr:GEVED domain-containing protein [Lysobacter maris]
MVRRIALASVCTVALSGTAWAQTTVFDCATGVVTNNGRNGFVALPVTELTTAQISTLEGGGTVSWVTPLLNSAGDGFITVDITSGPAPNSPNPGTIDLALSVNANPNGDLIAGRTGNSSTAGHTLRYDFSEPLRIAVASASNNSSRSTHLGGPNVGLVADEQVHVTSGTSLDGRLLRGDGVVYNTDVSASASTSGYRFLGDNSTHLVFGHFSSGPSVLDTVWRAQTTGQVGTNWVAVEYYVAPNGSTYNDPYYLFVGPMCADFGDAPDVGYRTLLASGGAANTRLNRIDTNNNGVADQPLPLFLGATVDIEPDGQPSGDAGGDGSDEDGVSIPATLPQGQASTIDVAVNQPASGAGFLSAWVDWNVDGDFDDAGEQISTDQQFTAGTSGSISLSVTPPLVALPSNQTFARFRWSSVAGVAATAGGTDGEVEDYAVELVPASDLAITKTNTPGVNGEVDQAGDTVVSGATTTYEIRVTNNGPNEVTGALVRDTPAAGLDCQPGNPVTISGDGVPAGGPFTVADLTGAGIALGALADDETTVLSFTCSVL